MRFGPVPLADALGAVLAHSVSVSDRRIRKGRILDETDLADLAASGYAEVIVAQPAPDDLLEDAAAKLLGTALNASEGLTLSDPFTGRVNVTASCSGVARIGASAILAANQVNPMITVATVPDLHQVDAGDMVATIKVISFAVPEADVLRAAKLLEGSLSVSAVELRQAELIVTEIPGGAGEKGVPAIKARLERLGVELIAVRTVAHEVGALADSLAESRSELVLILTGSATSDPQDVAPSAVRQAGGEVARFGMPVDPGNLLFIGSIGPRHVIGLPGCARSPALNGADWVLSRVACGINVGAEDIAAMGVGGLLKEIPTRPQPRRRKT